MVETGHKWNLSWCAVRGGYSDIFTRTQAQAILGGFKILNFNIFGGFKKNEYFWGYEDFVDIFGGSSQNWASLRVISMQFRGGGV